LGGEREADEGGERQSVKGNENTVHRRKCGRWTGKKKTEGHAEEKNFIRDPSGLQRTKDDNIRLKRLNPTG